MSGPRAVQWVEGLRGIAAVFIVTFHLATTYYTTWLSPAESDQALGSIFHLPILRLPASGQAWVAVFFTLTGYVVALKPIASARDGETTEAFSTLATSTLKRPLRLILPATIVTTLVWAMAQCGAFKMGSASGAIGVHDTSPLPSDSFGRALQDLVHSYFITWSEAENLYDHHQWAMAYILQGSMAVLLTLLATIRCSPLIRLTIFMGLYAFNWAKATPLYMTFYGGAALAELGTMTAQWNRDHDRIYTRIVSRILIPLGLLLCSCPVRDVEWTSWSHAIYQTGWVLFPAEISQHPAKQTYYWSSMGTLLLMLGIIGDPLTQRLLSNRAFVWLGGISLPIYLLHGPLMRSVLIWATFGLGTVDQDGRLQRLSTTWLIWVFLALFIVVVCALSHAWNLFVEPRCAWLTNRSVEWMLSRRSESAGWETAGPSRSRYRFWHHIWPRRAVSTSEEACELVEKDESDDDSLEIEAEERRALV